ncbi:hypothetical protein [Streptomyces bacillaris]|uniref:hypothetical protein n=1 Tax=Streptomyces bacillaris TaxID=68179 RepID=UPI003D71F782
MTASLITGGRASIPPATLAALLHNIDAFDVHLTRRAATIRAHVDSYTLRTQQLPTGGWVLTSVTEHRADGPPAVGLVLTELSPALRTPLDAITQQLRTQLGAGYEMRIRLTRDTVICTQPQ